MQIKLNQKMINIEVYRTFGKRLLGLMGQKNIKKSIVFPRCNSIHTFFMREEIDVIMTDRNGLILYQVQNLKPWRIILPKKNVYYTFEFPQGTINSKIKELQIFM